MEPSRINIAAILFLILCSVVLRVLTDNDAVYFVYQLFMAFYFVIMVFSLINVIQCIIGIDSIPDHCRHESDDDWRWMVVRQVLVLAMIGIGHAYSLAAPVLCGILYEIGFLTMLIWNRMKI